MKKEKKICQLNNQKASVIPKIYFQRREGKWLSRHAPRWTSRVLWFVVHAKSSPETVNRGLSLHYGGSITKTGAVVWQNNHADVNGPYLSSGDNIYWLWKEYSIAPPSFGIEWLFFYWKPQGTFEMIMIANRDISNDQLWPVGGLYYGDGWKVLSKGRCASWQGNLGDIHIISNDF